MRLSRQEVDRAIREYDRIKRLLVAQFERGFKRGWTDGWEGKPANPPSRRPAYMSGYHEGHRYGKLDKRGG